ncbi:hypothetical protein ACFOUP_06105 [Belliella kenyensis]|uniref:Uncharacterized protein n=1 Tax=Belliella kenyensis TaxID=1472724 RepID=A0ABV8EL54_9BACT|nr:hypothetical protein [Belliella kenyensis]MCH7401366.1 hypothetical protein [Belliella kenyensis]MDN3602809.1 hypothetical protein [Belliella kenyensis]
MTELVIYAIIFLLLIGHCLFAGKMYRTVHEDSSLSISEKNDWKLKALIFPALFWYQYKANKKEV